ncbi:MAG: hypothetical protein R3B90_14645 [Planctomycetaceae bacterium]
MTSCITNSLSTTTLNNGFGSDLRCVTVVGTHVDSMRERAFAGKRLHPAHRPSHAAAPSLPAQQAALAKPAAATDRARWSGSVPAGVPAAVDYALPPAIWATLVIAKAISA